MRNLPNIKFAFEVGFCNCPLVNVLKLKKNISNCRCLLTVSDILLICLHLEQNPKLPTTHNHCHAELEYPRLSPPSSTEVRYNTWEFFIWNAHTSIYGVRTKNYPAPAITVTPESLPINPPSLVQWGSAELGTPSLGIFHCFYLKAETPQKKREGTDTSLWSQSKTYEPEQKYWPTCT